MFNFLSQQDQEFLKTATINELMRSTLLADAGVRSVTLGDLRAMTLDQVATLQNDCEQIVKLTGRVRATLAGLPTA